MRGGLIALVVALAAAGTAQAAPGLFVGATEDNLKWRSAEALSVARDLGLKAFRITVDWEPGQEQLDDATTAQLDHVLGASLGMRVVVAVYGRADDAPQTPSARDQYCLFVRSLIQRYPTVNDVVIWNEPNLSYFWRPQFNTDRTSAAPAAYGQLLARCWDVLHEARAEVNVISNTSPRGNDRWWAPSNISHSPGNFIRRMAESYRVSGRAKPVFDTVGHHAYGHSAERPWKRHEAGLHIAQGDLDALLGALKEGFGGTAQPLPGKCSGGRCVSVWYLEAGYQTAPPASKSHLYSQLENDDHALPAAAGGEPEGASPSDDSLAPDQATQFRDGIRLAYCQPAVGAWFNFLLWDETDLGRWQSGVLWADGTKKESYDALKSVVAEVNEGRVDCGKLKGGSKATPVSVAPAAPAQATAPADSAERAQAAPPAVTARGAIRFVEWPTQERFPLDNTMWRLRIEVSATSSYTAAIYPIGKKKASLKVSGSLAPRRLEYVRFPRTALPRGRYRFEISVTTKTKPARRSRMAGPTFSVGGA